MLEKLNIWKLCCSIEEKAEEVPLVACAEGGELVSFSTMLSPPPSILRRASNVNSLQSDLYNNSDSALFSTGRNHSDSENSIGLQKKVSLILLGETQQGATTISRASSLGAGITRSPSAPIRIQGAESRQSKTPSPPKEESDEFIAEGLHTFVDRHAVKKLMKQVGG